MVLSMTVVVIMSKEDDDRNKAVEAVVAAGLGSLLIGGGLIAIKAIGDATKAENARSNGGNVVRHHSAHGPRGPPLPAPTCSEDNGRRMCCTFYGDYEDCSAYTGPDPTPWKRPKEFTSCWYSDGYLGCEFIHECSKSDGEVFCCYGDYCKPYTGPDPHDRLCQYDDGVPLCYQDNI